MITAELAGKLLEDVIYQRVLGCIDLDELSLIEHDLWASLYDLGPSDDEAWQLAREMLDQAFARIQRDPRRYLLQFDEGAACERLERAAQERGRDETRA